jgi:hypothetical protein
LSRLSLSTAYFVWTFGQVWLLIWLLWFLYDLTRAWEAQERRLLLSSVIAFPPLMLTFMLGAYSLLLTLCLLQFYVALKNGHDEWAGVWLVPMTVKPQAVILLGVVLLMTRRWRAIFTALIAGMALALLATWALSWQTWTDYLQLLRTHANLFDAFGVVPGDMHNFKGTLALLLGNEQGSLINAVSYGAFVAATLATAWLWRKPGCPADVDLELRMALTFLLGLLFNPHVNPQDSLMLIAPAILFYAYLRRCNLPRRAFAAFALCCPPIFLVSEFSIRGRFGIQIPVVAMAIFLVWLIHALYREGFTSQTAL